MERFCGGVTFHAQVDTLDFIPSVKELPHNFDHHNKLLLDASNPLLWNIKKYETDLKNERKKQYISVRSLTFTPEGNYLIGGTISGSLYIWNALLMLSENDDLRAEHTKPFRVIENISSSAIHYFLVAEDLLFCGTDTDLRCFSWNEILNSKNAKPEFTINVPSSSLNSINFEINQIRHFNGLLYLATGDSRVHIFSIQEKKFIKSLVGHSGYVLCLELYNNCKIVSGDSEGFIKIWNMCDLFCESTLVPTFSKEMNGIFPPISDMCIDTSATWLVVLSGKHIVLWHLPSQTQTFCLRSHVLLRCICWVENTIVVGGNSNILYCYELDGRLISMAETAIPSIYRLAHHEQLGRVLVCAGKGHRLGVFISLNYQSYELSLY